jgi:hypothetical protein
MTPGTATTATAASGNKKRSSTDANVHHGHEHKTTTTGSTTKKAKNNNSNNGGAVGTHHGSTTHHHTSKADMEKEQRMALHNQVGYTPLSLQDVRTKLTELVQKVPPLPAHNFLIQSSSSSSSTTTTTTGEEDPTKLATATTTTATTTLPVAAAVVPLPAQPCGFDKVAIRAWAVAMTHVIEEMSYLLPNISIATYQWGTNRSGAADQNLQLLLTEIARSQDQINNKVAPRLNDVLCPVVTLLTDRTVTTKSMTGRSLEDGGEIETKQNYFRHAYEDCEYVELCYNSVGRNAIYMRHLLLANLDKMISALNDYETADGKDKDSSRDFVY